jgi:(p)ppGpp synthase/HD superfamily hydrolase
MTDHFTIEDLQNLWQKVSVLHSGQTYGGPNPGEKIAYINHIGSVVFEIMNAATYTGDFNLELALKCALLHDSLEDTDISMNAIENEFGKQVLEGVSALTKNMKLDKAIQMTDSLERIKLQPKEVWAVKLADRICNLYAPPYYWDSAKKEKYAEEAKIIYDYLHEGNAYLANRLLLKIEAYKHK